MKRMLFDLKKNDAQRGNAKLFKVLVQLFAIYTKYLKLKRSFCLFCNECK